MKDLKSVNISPGVNVLSVFKYLNYKAWYALAEFVDNSLQSALDNSSKLNHADGDGYTLLVSIDFDDDHNRIVIEDNAAGIDSNDFARALRTAQLPSDRSGLSEFGVGLKSAAFWFAQTWRIETTALGEDLIRSVTFDLADIMARSTSELPVHERPTERNSHFTRVVLENVYRMPRGRTLGKIRTHLQSMYRFFSRTHFLELKVDGKLLEFPEVAILTTPPAWDLDAPPVHWRKSISFDFGDDLKAEGFAALRERGSTAEAGFALFRRGRLIEGSADEAYRLRPIFGMPNSFRSQRLFGELELTGFEVTHTKDGFNWVENEQTFLDLLEEEMNSSPVSLLRQADDYRVNRTRNTSISELPTGDPETSPQPGPHDGGSRTESETGDESQEAGSSVFEDPGGSLGREEFTFRYATETWYVVVELEETLSSNDLFQVQQEPINSAGPLAVHVRLNYNHPLIASFSGDLRSFCRVVGALGMAEASLRSTGGTMPGSVRRILNFMLAELEVDRL